MPTTQEIIDRFTADLPDLNERLVHNELFRAYNAGAGSPEDLPAITAMSVRFNGWWQRNKHDMLQHVQAHPDRIREWEARRDEVEATTAHREGEGL